MKNKPSKETQKSLDKYQEIYERNPSLRALDASLDGDLNFLDKIFLINKEVGFLDITPSEKWNWLHKILLGFDANSPSKHVVSFFISNGVEVNAQDVYGMTPLHYAMRSKNIEAAKVLLEAGADPNIPNQDNLIPLRMCIRYPDRLDLLELMLKSGGNVHYFNGEGYLLEQLKDFKGKDPKYKDFFELLNKYA
ncbi:hypothetical protein A4G20_07510 [Pasteurellaceae bacterium RH1A]|nr:hypothetical protein A4G20_07510 [Pasteurellaceae bacterium RH1A]